MVLIGSSGRESSCSSRRVLRLPSLLYSIFSCLLFRCCLWSPQLSRRSNCFLCIRVCLTLLMGRGEFSIVLCCHHLGSLDSGTFVSVIGKEGLKVHAGPWRQWRVGSAWRRTHLLSPKEEGRSLQGMVAGEETRLLFPCEWAVRLSFVDKGRTAGRWGSQ